MKQARQFLKKVTKFLFDVRVIYAVTGFIISIIAHELVHVLIHFGEIKAVHFFPNITAIIALDVLLADGYNIYFEELVAYGVTAVIQLITIIDVYAIHDSYDTRSVDSTVFTSAKR